MKSKKYSKKIMRIVAIFIMIIGMSGMLSACSNGSNNPSSSSNAPVRIHGKSYTVSIMTNTYFHSFGGVHSANVANSKIDHYLDRVTNLNDYSVHIYSVTLHHDFIHKIDYNITFIRK